MAFNRNHNGTLSKLFWRQQNKNKYSTCFKKNTFTKIPFEGCAVEGSSPNTFLGGRGLNIHLHDFLVLLW